MIFNMFKKHEQDFQADLEKARRFKDFYENSGFKELLDQMEDVVKQAVFSTEPTDKEGREELCRRVWAFQQVRQGISSVINNGIVAESELNKLRKTG